MEQTVLVVDDSITVRRMVTAALVDAGWPVLASCNGRDALAAIAHRQVHLVITDLNMPEMDGIELIRELRARPQYAKVPILVLTTEIDERAKQAARTAGATGWLGKPVHGEVIAQVAATLLN
ncbi:response regulator [Verticiella sediminum]|uniref:Response regulator n=1 Tax=Verticiella sediminum TaxID=1247510 RepID=A0A556AS09_9BURK|nr:response regulator [Verticiella sediminum]TSH95700.1 response regulator [Verticiella sediminum]